MAVSKIRPVLQSSSFWLGILLLASLLVGFNIFQDYGVSFDEPGIYNFAPVVLNMYSTAFDPPERPVYLKEAFLRRNGIPTDLFHYGPFYFMAVELFSRGLHGLGIQTPNWDAWHLAYFLTFEAGIVIFYLLCRRWLSGWASLGATLLFATQPLIVGHAFMNPKDAPFMVFFMAAVYSGLVMADKLKLPAQASSANTPKDLPGLAKTERRAVPGEKLKWFRRQVLFLAGLILLIIFAHPLWNIVLEQAVNALYTAPADSFPGSILRVFSSDPQKVPVFDFVTKAQAWLARFELLIVLLIAVRIGWLTYRLLPQTGAQLGRKLSRPFRSLLDALSNPWILLAGIVLGLTASNRLFAPLAAALVLVHLFWKAGRHAIAPSIVYIGVAWVTMYLTWPYLWGAAIKHLVKSWQVMNAFSAPGSPAMLPTLLATQYTIPAILLALAGTIIATMEFIRGRRSGLFFLFLGWAVFPVAVLILRGSSMYNNFRQVLFLLPPFFMIAGLAIETIIKSLRHPSLVVLLILLISLPGLWADIKLHPYQYAYYNELVDSNKSDIHLYNRDYWGISLKQIADYLNSTAPANTTIQACTSADIYAPYMRPDLMIIYSCDPASESDRKPDYIVLSSPTNLDTIPYPREDVVYSIRRQGATYAVVLSVTDDPK